MQRVLEFNGSDKDHGRIFGAIYSALRFGRNMVQQAPGKHVLRQERDIFRKLDVLSVADEAEIKKDPKARVLAPGEHRALLSQAEHELLMERIDKGPWGGDAACDMADALDFLGAAPEHKET